MRTHRSLSILTTLNLVIMIFILVDRTSPVEANNPTTVLRVRSLEIVDGKGIVRASIHVEPEGRARMADGSIAKDGKIYPETVLFRLIRPDGRPSVKISTSEEGSGLTLGGGIDPTYIVLSAEGGESSVSLVNKDGRQQLIKP